VDRNTKKKKQKKNNSRVARKKKKGKNKRAGNELQGILGRRKKREGKRAKSQLLDPELPKTEKKKLPRTGIRNDGHCVLSIKRYQREQGNKRGRSPLGEEKRSTCLKGGATKEFQIRKKQTHNYRKIREKIADQRKILHNTQKE